MKQRILSLMVVALFAAAGAQAAQYRTGGKTSTTRHVANADFVSYDTSTKSITIKDEKGLTSTARVQGGAVREMTKLHLKNGDHLTVTWLDNAKGEHQAITDIKLAKPKA